MRYVWYRRNVNSGTYEAFACDIIRKMPNGRLHIKADMNNKIVDKYVGSKYVKRNKYCG